MRVELAPASEFVFTRLFFAGDIIALFVVSGVTYLPYPEYESYLVD